ncbi:MAG: hypothetical protein WDN28_31425 [Chthoniobacter sp.]
MTRALLAKELRQHAFALSFLLLLPFGGLILISSHGVIRRAGGGGFESVRLLFTMFLPLACLVLGQLLIASEFRQKTQLFLEGLPLPRWRMLAVKFSLGLVLTLLISTLALGYVAWQARHTEAINPRFATLLLLKSVGVDSVRLHTLFCPRLPGALSRALRPGPRGRPALLLDLGLADRRVRALRARGQSFRLRAFRLAGSRLPRHGRTRAGARGLRVLARLGARRHRRRAARREDVLPRKSLPQPLLVRGPPRGR